MGEPQALSDILSTYAFKLGTGEIWGVPSRSEPDQIRIVVFFEEGTVVCSCPARLRCRHVGLAEDHRRRMHKPSRESAEQLFPEKLTQLGVDRFAVRKKDAPDHYLSEEASLDEQSFNPAFNLTTVTDRVAIYGSPEMARAAWRTFFNMEEGEVVRWSPESIEVVT